MFSEITVIIKDEEKSLRKKFPIYDPYQVDQNDPVIKDCVEETLKIFDSEPMNIVVKITLDID